MGKAGGSPHILLVMADQLAPQATGAYGHPMVRTPAMDRLAAGGCRFDAAYTNSPLCAPARFSFMSGQHITRIAAYDNASEFPASVPTFAHYLRVMGYHTVLSGKMHFVGPDQLHGFNERLTTDIYPADFAWTPNWELPDERIDKWYHNMDSVREAGVAATTFQLEYDDETGFHACRKIFDHAKRGGGQPLCMVVSFIHPHDPYVALRRWWDLYDHGSIDMPRVSIEPGRQDPFSRRLLAGIGADAARVTDAQVRNARHAYYANVSYVDDWVRRLVETLGEARMLDDTVVIVTADHGDMLGERGLWYKMNFFEWSARVPLILSGPGVRAGSTVPNACSLADLLPTMLDIAAAGGAAPPEPGQPLDGRSLWPLATGGGADNDPDIAISEYCAEIAPCPMVMVRQGGLKYIGSLEDPPMLFNLATDPDELRDLAANPAHAGDRDRLAAIAGARWDGEALKADVIAKQRQRRALHAAMVTGARTSWDYQPVRDASEEYVRNHMDWTVAAQRMRFPPLTRE